MKLRVFVFLIVCAGFVGRSQGAAMFTASGGEEVGYHFDPAFYSDQSYLQTSTGGIGGEVDVNVLGDMSYSAHAGSLAGSGFLRAFADVSFSRTAVLPAASLVDVHALGSATAIFDDMVITGPTGPVTARLNLSFSGFVTAGAGTGAGNSSPIASASVQVVPNVNNSQNGIGQGQVGYNAGVGIPPTYSTLFMTQNFPNFGSEVITSDPFTVQANVPFTVSLLISAAADVMDFVDNGTPLFATADFSHTLSFATTGNVMNLPSGYSLDSVEANISHNQFTLVDVPEPTNAAIALTLGVMLWRRRQNRVGGLHQAIQR